jgi:hypothetical protein
MPDIIGPSHPYLYTFAPLLSPTAKNAVDDKEYLLKNRQKMLKSAQNCQKMSKTVNFCEKMRFFVISPFSA